MGGTNLTVHLGLKINHTTIIRRVPRRATIQPWNRKGGSVCGDLFLGNKRYWGGGQGMANWQPVGPFQWVRPLSLLKHTTINLGSAGFGRNQPGDREAAPF